MSIANIRSKGQMTIPVAVQLAAQSAARRAIEKARASAVVQSSPAPATPSEKFPRCDG